MLLSRPQPIPKTQGLMNRNIIEINNIPLSNEITLKKYKNSALNEKQYTTKAKLELESVVVDTTTDGKSIKRKFSKSLQDNVKKAKNLFQEQENNVVEKFYVKLPISVKRKKVTLEGKENFKVIFNKRNDLYNKPNDKKEFKKNASSLKKIKEKNVTKLTLSNNIYEKPNNITLFDSECLKKINYKPIVILKNIQNCNQVYQNKYKIKNMSLYDNRIQNDERIVSNGYVANISNENSNAFGNQCSDYSHLASLCNIGNTCYLNSIVYTLRAAPQFLHKLHHLVEDLSDIHQRIDKHRTKAASLGRTVSGIQVDQRSWSSKDLASMESSNEIIKTNHEIALDSLHELYKNLSDNEKLERNEPFHADKFLHAIQQVSSVFSGNQHQDAHEFLLCILDVLRVSAETYHKSYTNPDFEANISEHTEQLKDELLQNKNINTNKSSFFLPKCRRKTNFKQLKSDFINIHQQEEQKSFDTIEDIGNSSKNSSSTTYLTENNLKKCDKNNITKNSTLNFFLEDFEGRTISKTKCLNCETVTEKPETMLDILVPISGYEDKDPLIKSDQFIQNACLTKEYFRGENKYRCEKCSSYTEAIRSVTYEVLPRLLIIQLSRFSGGMKKISSYLPTPFDLDCFCVKCYNEKDKLHEYKLYGVVTHVGETMSAGHYIAYICYLDNAKDYCNCPKEYSRKMNLNLSKNSLNNRSTSCGAPKSNTEKNVGRLKKFIFGKSKASSSGDLTQNINTTCSSFNCCSIRIKNNSCNNTNCNGKYINYNGSINNTNDRNLSSVQNNTFDVYNNPFNYDGFGRNKFDGSTEPIWFMCDDEKIKPMSQSEFKNILSPTHKKTPYLLFYARKDLK